MVINGNGDRYSELDKEYFDKGCERFNRECKGEIVTASGHVIKQTSLFDL